MCNTKLHQVTSHFIEAHGFPLWPLMDFLILWRGQYESVDPNGPSLLGQPSRLTLELCNALHGGLIKFHGDLVICHSKILIH